MNEARRRCEPPAAPPQPPSPAGVSVKPNRLRRSSRRSQSEPRAEVPQPEFKTPTRIPKSRFVGGLSEESPHNDSDFQQDIIWDASSPSPSRLSKRGKKVSAGVVNISEIVSRIAPKHGRPEVAEPTLQQWIGDSAAIPCTPDVQDPKPKKKSPRPTAVDDLLKLAKQFDSNMFPEDETDGEHQRRVALLSEDSLDFEDQHAAAVRPPAEQRMEDDLDFLFDGPTQCLSGNLSQLQAAPPSGASGKLPVPSSRGHMSGFSTAEPEGTSAAALEDDWENDDLLNDSLVFEMTQNPHKFLPLSRCSTQKSSSETRVRPETDPDRGAGGHAGPAVSNGGRDNVRQTFKLKSNHIVSEKKPPVDTLPSWTSRLDPCREDAQQRPFSSKEGVALEAGSHFRWQTCQSKTLRSDPPESQFDPKTSIRGSSRNHSPAAATAPKPAGRHRAPTVPVQIQNSVFLDEDLDSFFSSEPAWDDPDDDDLLCELCEDLENQIQSMDKSSAECRTSQTLHQRTVLQPSNRNQQSEVRLFKPANQPPASVQTFPKTQTSTSLSAGSCGPAAASSCLSNVSANPPRTQAKDSPGRTETKVRTQTTNGGVQPAAAAPTFPGDAGKGPSRFTFKKPHHPDPAVSGKAAVKCSAAEIELKKQQAMERRRQRLQATQNLRGPTRWR